MSASQETGTSFAQYEMPHSPSAFEQQKAEICKSIEQHYAGLTLNTRTIAYSSATFKEHQGKRIFTSLVVTLKEPIRLPQYPVPIHCLRWHYQQGVSVSDNELFYHLPLRRTPVVPELETEERLKLMVATRSAAASPAQATAATDSSPTPSKKHRRSPDTVLIDPSYSLAHAWTEMAASTFPDWELFLTNLFKLINRR